MSSGRTTVAVCFAAVGAALLIALVLFAPQPLWLGLLLVLLIPAVWSGLRGWRRRSPVPVTAPPPLIGPLPPRGVPITKVALPSARADYDFVFSASVRWLPIGAEIDTSRMNPDAVAVQAILDRARAITEQRDPARVSLVRHELSGALAHMQPDETGCLQAMAESVDLTLPAEDHNRLVALASVRKEEAVWEHERRNEQSKRAYFGQALRDTGSAVVWRLARHDGDVTRTVEEIGQLAQLASAANNTHVAEPFRYLIADLANGDGATASRADVGEAEAATAPPSWTPGPPRTPGDHFDAFLRSVGLADGDDTRTLLSRQFADLLGAHGLREVADELRGRFDIPDTAEPLIDDRDFSGEDPKDDPRGGDPDGPGGRPEGRRPDDLGDDPR